MGQLLIHHMKHFFFKFKTLLPTSIDCIIIQTIVPNGPEGCVHVCVCTCMHTCVCSIQIEGRCLMNISLPSVGEEGAFRPSHFPISSSSFFLPRTPHLIISSSLSGASYINMPHFKVHETRVVKCLCSLRKLNSQILFSGPKWVPLATGVLPTTKKLSLPL